MLSWLFYFYKFLFIGYVKNRVNCMRILITGATSGIGYGLGCQLIRNGHTVYMTAQTKKELVYLKEKIKRDGYQAICFKMDITTDDIFLVDNIVIDCLINHAGIGIGGSLLYMDVECLRENYEVNIFSSFSLSDNSAF